MFEKNKSWLKVKHRQIYSVQQNLDFPGSDSAAWKLVE